MATNNRNIRKQQSDLEFTLDHVREFEDGNISFSITIGRVTIYNCRIFKGPKGEFVGFPARMVPAKKHGETARYYNHARINDLTEEENAEILNAVYDKLDGKD